MRELQAERRHELVREVRRLEECIFRLRRTQGFLIGLVAAKWTLDLLNHFT